MRKPIICLIIMSFCIGLLSCSGSKELRVEGSDLVTPEWFANIPQNPNYLYSARTATSKDLQIAIDKATTEARAEIGRQAEIKIQAMQKRFDEEVGLAEDAELLQQFTQAIKTVVATSLTGSKISKQKQSKEGDLWRAFILVEYPIGATNEALMAQIKKNEKMFTRFRASEAFEELENEVKKYEDFKKTQKY